MPSAGRTNEEQQSCVVYSGVSNRGVVVRTGDSLVPVVLGVPVQRWEHERQHGGGVIADQAHDVLVVPEVQGALRDLYTNKRTKE